MHQRLMYLLVCAATGAMPFLCIAAAPQGREFFVAADGDDRSTGTKDKPFASLERARDAIRELKKTAGLPKGGLTVWLRGGTHERTRTFELTADDSGTDLAPIVYRACEGEEVRLSGGRRIEPSAFKPVADPALLARIDRAAHGRVVQADLKSLGITNYGEMKPRGFAHGFIPLPLELFFNDEPMTLARWPDAGFVETGKVLDTGPKVLQPGEVGQPQDLKKLRGRFSFPNDRIRRWSGAADVWAYGYWCWDWADEYLPVASVDAEKREIGLAAAHQYGLKQGKRFYVLNLIEELDRPCEWYLDRGTGILYFWPPAPIDKARVVVSILDTPLVSMKDCSRVTLRGLILEAARGSGVRIEGGDNCCVAGCVLRNLGTVGVHVGDGFQYGNTIAPTKGGTSNGVASCDIYNIAGTGIVLSGGDRKSLSPGRNFALNNDIHDFGRVDRTYHPAIELAGVGNLVSNNRIHDAPHTGIFFWGNDHVIDSNELCYLCRETADAGAIYIGRDWTMRGNVVWHNFIHHVGRYEGAKEFGGTMAIYLDDFASGTTVHGNIIAHVYMGVLIGGGHDNLIENNIFEDCASAAVHLDARGLGWAKNCFNGKDPILFDRLKAVNYLQPPYSKRYPKLAKVLEGNPALPKGNEITRNICFRGKWLHFSDGMNEQTGGVHDNLLTSDNPGFDVHPRVGIINYQLPDNSPVYTKLPGFKKIPFGKIGLYKDDYRASLPTAPRPEKSGTTHKE